MIKKILKSIKRFGFAYTFFYVLQRFGLVKTMPVSLLLKKQTYFKNLPLQAQIAEMQDFYKNETGKDLNMQTPSAFSEKLQWMKFYDSTKQKADLSDKYLAPRIIKEKYGDKIQVVPQLGVWDNADDIDFSRLPQKFVLKCTHGSAMNIIVKDKTRLNIKKTKKRLNDWLRLDYAYVMGMYENHYSFISPKIIAEQYIQEVDGNLHDYKIHCFAGEPKYIQLIGDRVPNSHQYYYAIYDANWNKTSIQLKGRPLYQQNYPKPAQLGQMLALAKDMSKDFLYVRVDFYILNDQIYFGELTFTPDSGFLNFEDDKVDQEWGCMIHLP